MGPKWSSLREETPFQGRRCKWGRAFAPSTFNFGATISQERLNPYVHKEMTDKINITDIGNQFVSASNDRQNRFGKFDVNWNFLERCIER